MISNEREALAELEARGFPPVFRQIAHGEIPKALNGSCTPIWYFYRFQPDLHDRFPFCRNYLPLWEVHSMLCVVAYDMQRDCYVQLYYEDDEDTVLGRSYQQFLTAVFLELTYAMDIDEFSELFPIFGYKHRDELVAYLDSDHATSDARQFIDSIGD